MHLTHRSKGTVPVQQVESIPMNGKAISRGSAGPPPAAPRTLDQAHVWLAEALEWARTAGATDLHLFPGEGEAMAWVRIDGALREIARYAKPAHERMIARLKVLARCTDYDGELVQEGRFALGGESEARLSVLPTLRGEKGVIRLIGGETRPRGLEELGYAPPLIAALRAALDQPQGMLLSIGPSGSGKTTALGALLADLNARADGPLSIATIEDPVELALPFAAQIAAQPARGMGFAQALRAVLRQDVEAIMIGEIRDAETAATALQAAMTGHRLLSSMHTLTAAEALVRLQQMGIAAYVIASAVGGLLNVRLARLLCPVCRERVPLDTAALALAPEAADWDGHWIATGCDACGGSGHAGRTGLGEWFVTTPATAAALHEGQPSARVAATLTCVSSARPQVLALAHEGRLALGELARLSGIAQPAAEASS